MNPKPDTIPVTCNQCGEKFRAPRSAIGRNGKCKCGNVLYIRDVSLEAKSLGESLKKLIDESTNRCAYHEQQTAIEECVKCQKPLCEECAIKTRSGAFACQPCIHAYRASKRPDRKPSKDEYGVAEVVSSAEEFSPDRIYEVELVEPTPMATNLVNATAVTHPVPMQSHISSQSFDTSWDAFSRHVPAIPWSVAIPSQTQGTALSANLTGERCAQHAQARVVHHCTVCQAPVCRTCVFVFPPNVTCCPKCATDTEVHLSPHRKWLIFGSLACAILSTLTMALLFSGLLSALLNAPFMSFIIETLIVGFLCAGLGMAIGSANPREGNTALLWTAGIWNLLGLLGWIAFLILIAIAGYLSTD